MWRAELIVERGKIDQLELNHFDTFMHITLVVFPFSCPSCPPNVYIRRTYLPCLQCPQLSDYTSTSQILANA